MCSFSNLHSFLLLTSISFTFINCYGRSFPFVIWMKNFNESSRINKFIICNMRRAIVCTLCTVTEDLQLCVPYVELLQVCNPAYLMYSYCRCAILCFLCTVTADVQSCDPQVQLLQMCNPVYLMNSYCRCAILCVVCTITADVQFRVPYV